MNKIKAVCVYISQKGNKINVTRNARIIAMGEMDGEALKKLDEIREMVKNTWIKMWMRMSESIIFGGWGNNKRFLHF